MKKHQIEHLIDLLMVPTCIQVSNRRRDCIWVRLRLPIIRKIRGQLYSQIDGQLEK